MISEKLAKPESVPDFIEGRTPKKVGAKPYTKLLMQAEGYYGRYSFCLGKLKNISEGKGSYRLARASGKTSPSPHSPLRIL